jgi:hypothetical protein
MSKDDLGFELTVACETFQSHDAREFEVFIYSQTHFHTRAPTLLTRLSCCRAQYYGTCVGCSQGTPSAHRATLPRSSRPRMESVSSRRWSGPLIKIVPRTTSSGQLLHGSSGVKQNQQVTNQKPRTAQNVRDIFTSAHTRSFQKRRSHLLGSEGDGGQCGRLHRKDWTCHQTRISADSVPLISAENIGVA